MLGVASAGLVVNLIAMRILAGSKDASLNVKGAYLEVWADMLGSLGVIGAAIAIYFSGATWIDPLVAIAIGLWVLPRTWVLLHDTTKILLQGVPRGTELAFVRAAIVATPGVASAHDLHSWSVAGDDARLTAHIVADSERLGETVRNNVQAMLEERFNFSHVTIQTEAESCTPGEVGHP